MIFSQAQRMVDESITLQKEQFSKDRRKLVYKLLDYYNGDNTAQYIEPYFNADSFREIPCTSMNITKRFIDRLSQIYTLGASRTLDRNQDVYNSLTRFKDVKMKHLEKMTRLLGTIAVKIDFKEGKYNNDQPCFDYSPKYAFDVITDEFDPMKVKAIKYPVMFNTDDGIDNNEILQYVYYDDQGYIIYDEDGKQIEAETHDFGVLPFIFLHKQEQQLEFFCPPAYDIMSTNEMINILYSEMNLGMRFQMFGQYVISGFLDDKLMERAGSDQMIVLPEGADLSIVAPSVNVSDALRLGQSMLQIVASNNHLTISFEENHSDRPQSGVALAIRDLERKTQVVDDLNHWELYEQQIYDMERLIASNNGISLPNSIGIDFNEPEDVMSKQEEISYNQFLLDNNLTTPAKILQKMNKDLTLEQAEAIIKENEEVNGTEQNQSIFSRLQQGTQTT
tara:strand:- start:61 stop:1407 length:1347 start_codon:yes stop_codon:yes gene_type:complete